MTIAYHEHAVQRGLRRVGPGPRPYAGGDQQSVEPHFLAVGEADPFTGQIEAGRGYAEQPVRIQVPGLGQGGALRRHPPVEDLLG